MNLDNIIESVKEEVTKGQEALEGSITETEHKITDAGHRKMKDLVDELHEDLPIFERAGYKLHSLEVELGITPKLIPHFKVEKHISKEEQQTLLNEVKHKRVLHLLLSSLFKASYLKKVLRIGNLDFNGLKIELSAIPTVRLLFWESDEKHDEEFRED